MTNTVRAAGLAGLFRYLLEECQEAETASESHRLPDGSVEFLVEFRDDAVLQVRISDAPPETAARILGTGYATDDDQVDAMLESARIDAAVIDADHGYAPRVTVATPGPFEVRPGGPVVDGVFEVGF